MKYLNYFLLILFGTISNFGFAPYNYLPVFFMALAGLLYILINAESKKQAFLYGYLFGFFHFAFGLSWIGNALLVDDYTIQMFGWLLPLFYIGSGLILGLFFALPALLMQWGKSSVSKLMLFATSFTIFEISREFLLTGFPWNKLGAVWSNYIYVLNSVSFIGTNGLTLITILLAGCLTLAFKFKDFKKTTFYFISTIFIIFFALITINCFHIKPISYTNKTVKIVQSGIKQKFKWNVSEVEKNFQTHIDLSHQGNPADFIIWSETSSPYDLSQSPNAFKMVSSILNDSNYLITGFLSADLQRNTYNSLGFFKKEGMIEIYSKSHLVPFGEYMPFKKYIPLPAIANQMSDITAGDGLKTITINDFSFSPLICYESIFSTQVVQKGTTPDALLILTNDAWYGLSSGPYQHLAEAQLRSIEEGIPAIRSSYNGISAIIDPYGRILQSLPLNHKGIIDSKIPNKAQKTLYSYTHFWPTLAFCMSFILSFLITAWWKNRCKKRR